MGTPSNRMLWVLEVYMGSGGVWTSSWKRNLMFEVTKFMGTTSNPKSSLEVGNGWRLESMEGEASRSFFLFCFSVGIHSKAGPECQALRWRDPSPKPMCLVLYVCRPVAKDGPWVSRCRKCKFSCQGQVGPLVSVCAGAACGTQCWV